MAANPIAQVSLRELGPGRPILFEFERGGENLSGFILEYENELHAYVNRCPHVTYPLDFADGELMDPTRKFIMCQAHGARFLPETGECFWGPALGRSLERLPCKRDGEFARVEITPEIEGWPACGGG